MLCQKNLMNKIVLRNEEISEKIPKLDIFYDIPFKKIFSDGIQEEGYTTWLLNSILEHLAFDKVESLRLINREESVSGEIDSKRVVADIAFMSEKEELFIFEMQRCPQLEIFKRALYEISLRYTEQLKSGQDFTNLKRVTLIFFLNYEYISNDFSKGINHFTMHEKEYSEIFGGKDLNLVFIEFPFFNEENLMSSEIKVYKYLCYITNLNLLNKKYNFIQSHHNTEMTPEDIEKKERMTEFLEQNIECKEYLENLTDKIREIKFNAEERKSFWQSKTKEKEYIEKESQRKKLLQENKEMKSKFKEVKSKFKEVKNENIEIKNKNKRLKLEFENENRIKDKKILELENDKKDKDIEILKLRIQILRMGNNEANEEKIQTEK